METETRTETVGKNLCRRVRVYRCNTVVVGTGAAGYNAALRLSEFGQQDTVMVTEGICCGTSRNTGSDKQTYYKLNLSGEIADSPADMAKDLFRGRCVDGDHAYAEAAQSAQCFLRLAEIGVRFPVNRFGEYVGYKTDHDPRARATSAGPLTSKEMTESLEKEVARRGIQVFDRMRAVSVLKDPDGEVAGLIALSLSKDRQDAEDSFVLFSCRNIVYATGGPAGIYSDRVYPVGHTGSSGVPLLAGAKGKNLTEWQYGLASVSPRWNVSGTYMQVLPRFFSVDESGVEHEFLSDYFPDIGVCLSRIFLKGYQWPFDCAKALDGSSLIDLLVYRETAIYGRKVYLDFRNNPGYRTELPFSAMTEEAYRYLSNADACFGKPIDRLLKMNEPAYTLYLSKGLDLKKEPLQIALCAQHNNGGIDVDLWWQTAVPGLFSCGEAAGTHGVTRPGGSALNAGQVGSLRAARYIASKRTGDPLREDAFFRIAEEPLREEFARYSALTSGGDNVDRYEKQVTEAMSRVAGAIRDSDGIRVAIGDVERLLSTFEQTVRVPAEGIEKGYRLRDILVTQLCYLTAMRDYIDAGGKSRGSAIYVSGEAPCGARAPEGFSDAFGFQLDGGEFDGKAEITELHFDGKETYTVTDFFRPVRPLPEGGGFFENVWRRYREDGNVF